MPAVPTWRLRASFALRLSVMYAHEVPAYNTLVEVTAQVNSDVLGREGADAQRLGSLDRVTAERHGAIRVGTTDELREVARIFAAFGMYPVGFYDLREAPTRAVPLISTAFRPVDEAELARNPFGVFTSLLVTDDRRFFHPDLQRRLDSFLTSRRLFPPKLLHLADRAAAQGGLTSEEAERFLDLATSAFELSPEPVDRAWYDELAAVSGVAADVGAATSTHLNHLAPRVLDIDDLYARMEERGITMVGEIQGPPRWKGCDVLLRRTSFHTLTGPRRYREPNGQLRTGSHRVRLGEVESRGIALTPKGRARYDAMVNETHRRMVETPTATRQAVARDVWEDGLLPTTEADLVRQDVAFFRFRCADRPRPSSRPPRHLSDLLTDGWVAAEPIVYEDFLPRSSGGPDVEWLSGVLGREVHEPVALYAAQRAESLRDVARQLDLDAIDTHAGPC